MSTTESISAKAGGGLGTWHVLWRLVRAQPWLFVLDAVLQVPRQSVFLVTGLVVARYFEVVSDGATGDAATIGVLVAVLLGTYAARIAIVIGAVATNETFAQHGAALLRRNAFAHLLSRPGALPLTHAPGEIVSRLMGDAQTVSRFQYRLLRTLGDTAMAVAAVVVLAHVDAWLTALVVLPVLLVGAAGNVARRSVQRSQRAHRDAVGRSSAFLGDMFGTVQAIQVAGAEERAAHRFRELNARRRDTALQGRLFEESIGVLTHGTAAVGTGAVLLLVANAMRSGTFTIGELTLFAYYLPAMATFTSSLGGLIFGFQRATVSVERLVGVLEGSPPTTLLRRSARSSARPLLTGDQPAGPPVSALELLEVRGLSYRHPGSGRGIEGVSLTLARGGCTVITGRTGSGKTTLLRVLLGLLPRDGGEILWNGQVVHSPGAFFVPPRTAYSPQVPHLFSATLRENVLLGLFVPSPGGPSSPPSPLLGREGTKDVREAVSDQAQLERAIASAITSAVFERDLAAMPNGLDTLLGPNGVRLSGGQARRATAARMFVRQPDLLVCDDLSSALDGETEEALWERLFTRQGRTVLVVSHRPAAIARADHILVLEDGKIRASGTLRQLLQSDSYVQALYAGPGTSS